MSKKINLQDFFKSHFPMGLEPRYIMFENMKTGWFDVVGRSGFVLFSVPPMPGEEYKDRKALADEILDAFEDGDCPNDGLCNKLCGGADLMERGSSRFDYPNWYPAPEYPYHPDDFAPYSGDDVQAFLETQSPDEQD